jgi:hypothetical protein
VDGVVDLLSYYAIGREHSALKQRLLEETTVSSRTEILLRYLRSVIEAQRRSDDTPDEWPPPIHLN